MGKTPTKKRKASSSPSALKPRRGRPKKIKVKEPDTSRVGNYRTKYSQDALQKAMREITEDKISVREAAKKYKVSSFPSNCARF